MNRPTPARRRLIALSALALTAATTVTGTLALAEDRPATPTAAAAKAIEDRAERAASRDHRRTSITLTATQESNLLRAEQDTARDVAAAKVIAARKAAIAKAKAQRIAKAKAAAARKAAAKAKAARIAKAKAKAQAAAAEAAREAAARQDRDEPAQPEAPTGTVSASKAALKAYARTAAARRGWGPEQFTAIDAIWTQESQWNPLAENPSSGAYGIPQALPGTKMSTFGDDWRTNGRTQIDWGLDYMADRYGTPTKAWAFKKVHGWY